MRKVFSGLLSLLLVMMLVPINSHANTEKEASFDEYGVRSGTQATYNVLATANEWDEEWTKKDVSLLHEWTINFSDIATEAKIESIIIEHKGKPIDVTVTYNQSEIVKVKPKARYLAGQDYTLKVLLKNGKKYKMDFTTTKQGVDVEPNKTKENASNLYVNETIEGSVSTTDKEDFYRLTVPQNGELKLSLSSTSDLSMTLLDQDATDGDILAYKNNAKTITLTRELKAGTYYVRVEGEGNYTLDVKHTAKSISAEQALINARDAVYALPARLDVQERHREEIDQAITLINTAKLVGADALEIEKLERIITELFDVILPIEVTALVSNSKTVLLTFNRPVQSKLAYIKVNGKDAKSVTFNANQTIARVEMAEALKEGPLGVSVEGIAPKPILLKNNVTVEAEKATAIEIIGNTANRIGGDVVAVTVPYRVFNQYGEEMDLEIERDGKKVTVTATVEGITNIKTDAGLVTIPVADDIAEGSSLKLTLTADTATTEKTVTVSLKEAVATVEIKGLNKADLNERTNFATETYYLIIEAKDKFGKPITDIDLLNQEGNIHIFNYAPKIVGIAPKFEKVDDEIRLPLTGPLEKGATTVTLTALQTKAESSFEIKVDESTRTDTIKLIAPTEAVTEGKPLLVEIQTNDKSGKPITEKDVLTNVISGITWIIEPNVNSKVIEKDGKLKLEIKGADVRQGSITIKAQTSTLNTATLTVPIDEKVRPTKWEENAESPIEKEFKFTNGTSNPPEIVLDEKSLTILDQYNKVLENPFTDTGYSLVLTEENLNGGAIKVVGNKVQAVAVGTEKVTVAIHNGNQLVAGSAKDITFTVTSGDYIQYNVAPIETIYDEVAAGNKNNESYDKPIIVYGVLSDGTEVALKHDTDYKVSAVHPTLNEDVADGILNVDTTTQQYTYSNGATSITPEIIVEIKASGEEHRQRITISKTPPIVKEIKYEAKPVLYDATGGEFDLTELVAKIDTIKAKDQYGVESSVLGTVFTFPDGTVITPTIQFNTKTGGQLFSANGSPAAKVTEFSPNSSFETVLSANGASASIIVQVENDSMPSLQAEIDKITVEELSELQHGQNVQTIVQNLVNEKYSITIKDSKNAAIALDGRVTQSSADITGNVIFTVTHKESSAFTQEKKINLTVKAAETVFLTQDSLGKPANTKITGLTTDIRYVLYYDGNYYGVQSVGTLNATAYATAELAGAASARLTGTEITGLMNGRTYKVETLAPQTVLLAPESKGTAANKKITELVIGTRYIVIEGTGYYGVLEDGTLSRRESTSDAAKSHAVPLKSTEIRNLTNGTMYKVEEVDSKPLTNVTATAGDGKATIRFTEPLGATTVQIQKQKDNGAWENDVTVDATTTVAVVSGLENGSSYKFRIVVTGGGYHGTSNETAAVTPVAPLTDVEGTAGNQQVTLKFTAPTGATNVKVEQSINGTSWATSTTTLTLTESSTEAIITGLKNGDNYRFRVVVTGGGHAGTSNIVYNMIPEAVISIQNIPGNLTPTAGGTPITTIKSTEQYDAIISWSPNITPFEAEQVYTATITLTAKKGYTLQGVGADFFSVLGATTTNDENSGIITAVFPAIPAP